jgi:hypothetical protein
MEAARTSLSAVEQQERRRNIAACLELHQKFALEFCQRQTDAAKYGAVPESWPMTPELSLSIGVLAAALFLNNKGWNIISPSWKFCAWGMEDIMVASGWCPSLLSEFQAVDDLYTAHTLGRLVVAQDHAGKKCNALICNVNQIDESTYSTRHVVHGCNCDFKGPKVNEVVECLKHGFLPAIQVDDNEDGLDVRVIRKWDQDTTTSSYVAVSHVCTLPSILKYNRVSY